MWWESRASWQITVISENLSTSIFKYLSSQQKMLVTHSNSSSLITRRAHWSDLPVWGRTKKSDFFPADSTLYFFFMCLTCMEKKWSMFPFSFPHFPWSPWWDCGDCGAGGDQNAGALTWRDQAANPNIRLPEQDDFSPASQHPILEIQSTMNVKSLIWLEVLLIRVPDIIHNCIELLQFLRKQNNCSEHM